MTTTEDGLQDARALVLNRASMWATRAWNSDAEQVAWVAMADALDALIARAQLIGVRYAWGQAQCLNISRHPRRTCLIAKDGLVCVRCFRLAEAEQALAREEVKP